MISTQSFKIYTNDKEYFRIVKKNELFEWKKINEISDLIILKSSDNELLDNEIVTNITNKRYLNFIVDYSSYHSRTKKQFTLKKQHVGKFDEHLLNDFSMSEIYDLSEIASKEGIYSLINLLSFYIYNDMNKKRLF